MASAEREPEEGVDTLEAELRQALQHQRAELARAQEAREELARTLERARAILERSRGNCEL